MLELDDIQSGVLRPLPNRYMATYIAIRIDDRRAGRKLMDRVSKVVTSAANPSSPVADTWVSVALTYEGLAALGVPQQSLDSFAWEFRQGMAARAKALSDIRESSPENWEKPFGTADVHVVIVAVAPDAERLETALSRARGSYRGIDGIEAIWRQDCHALPNDKELFGFRDGTSHPAIEGSGIPASNPTERPLRAGEFVLGYLDELDGVQKTDPELLGRNGTYVVFQKLQQRVADFRRYLKANSKSRAGGPELEPDPRRKVDFHFAAHASSGFKTPGSSHNRRANPRDAALAGVARTHRMIQRGTRYGPRLPEGVLDDDGAERGLMFSFVGAHIGRQFEFVQSQCVNDGEFVAAVGRDPVIGHNGGTWDFKISRKPRSRCQGISQFVITRGGEYCFMPGIRALRWLADLES